MAVVGAGLIGTSVALAARRGGVAVHLLDADEANAATAVALGAGVLGPPREPVDLAVLAVPPSAVVTVLAEQRARQLAEVYTDVASVKGAVTRAGEGPGDFIGGHPLAGRERSGPLASRADLFEGRPWVLAPSPETPTPVLNRVLELVSMCGAIPVLMGSQEHDAAVALTSHVPHLVASLTAARLQGGSHDALRLAGQGLRDVTRVAAGDPRLWADILRANALGVAAVLRELTGDLTRVLAALDELAAVGPTDAEESAKTLVGVLEQGVAGLDRIGTRTTRPGPHVQLRVSVGRRPGELARLLAALAESGITADDLTPVHSLRQGTLAVLFAVPLAPARRVIAGLSEEGWQAEIWDPQTAPRTPTGGGS
ncbi:prephenate dehydrogenase [Streptomyces sp. NPDC056161]|uniref:prephenate dehydrogenase n=1 Tax=Streptomyces sp. NPDC056161 TaxID=3345732 RepID=UPI0035E0F694